ncbi:hypothetical protein CEXT_685971 [Caerostris extrusa]|uniref:Uncharacterized protein n=1 Tax=Caerostris extrusa TaxID=172846 RepID=A0AAV4RX14_CAEEX|nr:hypothetical protein CEXT_685971 [Caerostris extrusa]
MKWEVAQETCKEEKRKKTKKEAVINETGSCRKSAQKKRKGKLQEAGMHRKGKLQKTAQMKREVAGNSAHTKRKELCFVLCNSFLLVRQAYACDTKLGRKLKGVARYPSGFGLDFGT